MNPLVLLIAIGMTLATMAGLSSCGCELPAQDRLELIVLAKMGNTGYYEYGYEAGLSMPTDGGYSRDSLTIVDMATNLKKEILFDFSYNYNAKRNDYNGSFRIYNPEHDAIAFNSIACVDYVLTYRPGDSDTLRACYQLGRPNRCEVKFSFIDIYLNGVSLFSGSYVDKVIVIPK